MQGCDMYPRLLKVMILHNGLTNDMRESLRAARFSIVDLLYEVRRLIYL